MFTGIIQDIGEIVSLDNKGADLCVRILTNNLQLSDVELGDSIAVDGVCLTVIALEANTFSADISIETINCTTFKMLKPHSNVNLEKALTATTRLGGHMVSGHVDAMAEIIKRNSEGRSEHFVIKAPKELAKYIATKGSICVNGISLTVNSVNGNEFTLNIVPHTLQETNIDQCQQGYMVNLEVDVISRYLERLMLGESAALKTSNIDEKFLTDSGFIK